MIRLYLHSVFILRSFKGQGQMEQTVPDFQPLYEPDPVEFSFDTPAWYTLFVLLGIVLLYSFWLWHRGYRKNAYRREAIRTLAATAPDDSSILTIQVLLKNVAIKTYGRKKVAGLFGKEWLCFLEETGKNTPFSNIEVLYMLDKPEAGKDRSALINEFALLTKKWIRTHA